MIDMTGEFALADMAYLACLESHGGLVLCANTEVGHQKQEGHLGEGHQRGHLGDGFVSAGPCLVSARALWLIESGRFEALRDHLDECEHYYALLAEHAGSDIFTPT